MTPEGPYIEDEISIKELIQVLLKEKKLIGLISMGVLLCASIFTFLVLSPTYESGALITLNLEEELDTPYGSYAMLIREVREYTELVDNPQVIQRTLQELGGDLTRQNYLDSINTESLKDTNSFRLTASGGSPEEAYELASASVDSYLEIVEVLHRKMLSQHFLHTTADSIKELNNAIEDNDIQMQKTRELLEQAPMTFDLKSALLSQAEFSLWLTAEEGMDITDLGGDTIVSQELNPTYLKILDMIANLEMTKINLEKQLAEAVRDHQELDAELLGIAQYEETLSAEDLYDGQLTATKNMVSVVSSPEINMQKVGPKNGMNLAIGLVLGVMLGVFVAFFKHYWQQ